MNTTTVSLEVFTAASVDWRPGYQNDPDLVLNASAMPGFGAFTYTEKNHTYFGVLGPWVQFFYYEAPDQGYGGRHFTINVAKDSGTEEVTLKGPWSSRPAAVMAEGFTDCVDVIVKVDGKPSRYGTNITADAARALLEKFLPELKLVKVWSKEDGKGEARYVIHPKEGCTADHKGSAGGDTFRAGCPVCQGNLAE